MNNQVKGLLRADSSLTLRTWREENKEPAPVIPIILLTKDTHDLLLGLSPGALFGFVWAHLINTSADHKGHPRCPKGHG